MEKGKFIAIEGGDGSGKGTQAELLKKYFEEKDQTVFKISFPQYGKPSAKIVEKYLNGEFGQAGSVAPELASLPYALDRFAAAPLIREKLDSGTIVIADRYMASNLAHQATGIENHKMRREFYKLLIEIEFGLLGIPKPDMNIVLAVPTEMAQANVDKKGSREYTDKKRDIHEADFNHLENAKRNYIELCELYPEEFIRLDCLENNQLLPIPDVHSKLLSLVDDILVPGR